MSILTKIKDWWFDFIRPRQKPFIVSAGASMQHRSMSRNETSRRGDNVKVLSPKAWDRLHEAIDAPAKPAPALVALMRRNDNSLSYSDPSPAERFNSTYGGSIMGSMCGDGGGSSYSSGCSSSSSSDSGSSSSCD